MPNIWRKTALILAVATAAAGGGVRESAAASRIKDIVNVEGVRDNMLIGYGLVVGLNGTGDNLRNSPFTEKGLQDFLSRLGYSMKGENLKTRNIAAVTVTGLLAPFARAGSRFDVTVSTMGDSKSLQGGVLLATPLLGPDGNVYGVAQGTVTLGKNSDPASGAGASVPTVGAVPSGAIVERETDFKLDSLKELTLALKNPDISTARRISERVNEALGEQAATAPDPGTVKVKVPEIYGKNVLNVLADIEQLYVEPDRPAQVVVDESSGTVVISEGVKVDTVAISQGNLMIAVNSEDAAKSGFQGESAKKESGPVRTDLGGPGKGFAVLAQGADLRDLVDGLNALGVKTRDLISILNTIKSAGALQADIVVR